MWKDTAVVTGGSSGLGREIVARLLQGGWRKVVNLDRKMPVDGTLPGEIFAQVDITDQSDFYGLYGYLGGYPVSLLINNAGVNEISMLEDLEPDTWEKVMGVNAKGIFNMSKLLLPNLVRAKGTILNITSNAAWVPMTSSLAYNASKAAANMMTVQMAHENHRLKRPITVFAIAPGKLAGTPMSDYIEGRVVETRGWTPEYAAEYQLASLKAGAETPPHLLAEFISFLVSSKARHKQLAGCILPYGA